MDMEQDPSDAQLGAAWSSVNSGATFASAVRKIIAEQPNLSDPAVQYRLATQWGYVRAAPAPVAPQPCEWSVDDGIWQATCHPAVAYSFTEGGPIENGHKHCHSCGRPLVVVPQGEA